MKKLLLATGIFLTSIVVYSQSFNTGEILQPRYFSAGINPVLEDKHPGIYFHGGYGISKQLDFNFKYGFFSGPDYLGADLEWGLRKAKRMNLSLVTGAHVKKYFGLDLGLAASFPVSFTTSIFSGIDADFNFNLNNDRFFWLPLGVEVRLSKRASFLLEADIPLVDFAAGIFGGGVVFYLY
jgi:hypothetical protein